MTGVQTCALPILCDFTGNIINEKEYSFTLEDSEESYNKLISLIEDFLSGISIPLQKVVNMGISIPGRVNTKTGVSYSFFYDDNHSSFAKRLESQFGISVIIENDTRPATYGEFICGTAQHAENALFVNITWGMGVGIIADKKIYYGKSGYS